MLTRTIVVISQCLYVFKHAVILVNIADIVECSVFCDESPSQKEIQSSQALTSMIIFYIINIG